MIKQTFKIRKIAIRMELRVVILIEAIQRQTLYDITYTWNLKKKYKGTYLQNRNRITDIENKLIFSKCEREDKLGVQD